MTSEDPLQDVWVVVPMYNEAKVIGDTISDLRRNFRNIVCVDDASSDDSAQLAAQAGARVVQHPINLGQGAALQTGMEYALSDPQMGRVVTFDADGQHSMDDAIDMCSYIGTQTPSGKSVDVVLGSRFLDDRSNVGWTKRIILRLAIKYTNWSVGIKLTDTHNGLRVLSRKATSRMHITQDGMAHATEILEQIVQADLGYIERPVKITYTDYSKSKGQSLLNSVNILVELLLR